jgi:hypothetical protein
MVVARFAARLNDSQVPRRRRGCSPIITWQCSLPTNTTLETSDSWSSYTRLLRPNLIGMQCSSQLSGKRCGDHLPAARLHQHIASELDPGPGPTKCPACVLAADLHIPAKENMQSPHKKQSTSAELDSSSDMRLPEDAWTLWGWDNGASG